MSCSLILAGPKSQTSRPAAKPEPKPNSLLLDFLGFPELFTNFVLKPDDIYTSGMERLAARLTTRGMGWREALVAFSPNPLTSSHRNN